MEQEPNDILVEEIKKLRETIERDIVYRKNWRVPLRNGMLIGLGSAIGATLLFSLVFRILQPLKEVTFLREAIESLKKDK